MTKAKTILLYLWTIAAIFAVPPLAFAKVNHLPKTMANNLLYSVYGLLAIGGIFILWDLIDALINHQQSKKQEKK